MATKTTTTTEKTVKTESEPFNEEAYLRELVEIVIPRDKINKGNDDFVAGVNGRIYQLKRGVPVKVPRYVYNVILQSMEQDGRTLDLIEGFKDRYAEAARALNI